MAERFKSDTELTPIKNSFGFDGRGENPIKDNINVVKEGGLAVTNTAVQLGTNLSDAFKDLSKSPTNKQMKEIGEAMVDATKEYWEKKKENLKLAWNTHETVTIGSIVGRVADCTYGDDKIWDDLSTRLARIVANLTGVQFGDDDDWGDLLYNIGDDFLAYVTSDSEVGGKVAEIDTIKGLVKTVKTANQFKRNISNVLETIEPILPYAELLWEFASAFMSGGTSLIKATTDLDKQAQLALWKLIVLTLQDLKKMVFSWKIEAPSIILGSLNALTRVEGVNKYSTGKKWLDELLNEDYYKQIKSQAKWNKTLKETINEMNNLKVDIEWKNSTVSTIFTDNLVKNSLKNLVSTAYSTTGISEKEFESWEEVGESIMEWYKNEVLYAVADFLINKVGDNLYVYTDEDFRMSEMTEEQIAVNSALMLKGLD